MRAASSAARSNKVAMLGVAVFSTWTLLGRSCILGIRVNFRLGPPGRQGCQPLLGGYPIKANVIERLQLAAGSHKERFGSRLTVVRKPLICLSLGSCLASIFISISFGALTCLPREWSC